MFLQGSANPLFATGVPLFIMLTGYLNANKTVSRKYYRGCVRVLFAYLLFSIVTILFRRYYMHEELPWLQWCLKVLDFSAIPYGWYIEMWIGLFLLTPFLNMLYKAIPTRRQKHVLLLTLYLMTALPDLLNRYGLHLVPGFWVKIYPLMFFFAGSYVREYSPQPAKWKLMAIIVLLCIINPTFNVLFVNNHTMISPTGGFAGVTGTVIAVAVFLLLYKVDFGLPWLRAALMKVSVFGIYFFVIVPILFAGSFAIAWVKDTVCKRVSKQL